MDSVAENLAVLQEETDALIAVYDPGDRLRYANRAFRNAYFVEEGETPRWPDLMRRNHVARRGTVIEAPDFEIWLSSVKSRRGKIASRCIETSLYDGRWIWIVETVRPDGWMMFVGTDITELGRSERSLRQDRDHAVKAAVTCDLTGISNRRHILAGLDLCVERAERLGTDFCLCLLDLDHFKSVNDVYGHPAGDDVLIAFARLVRSTIRLKDLFGRVGGEEFLLILPETGLADAAILVHALFDLVRRARPLRVAPDFGHTCSGGLIAWTPGATSQSLYAQADAALYRAKKDGRDRIASV